MPPSALTPFDRLKAACADDWRAYCQHDFVRQLGAGTLPGEAFRHYLEQDYLFLIHFARAWGLAVYKSRSVAELRQGLDMLKAIVDVELGLHVDNCRQWGVAEDDLLRVPEARATMAYTRYVLDAGNRGDLLDLHVALVPCMIGYAEIATWLNAQPFLKRDGNPYASWIAMYASDEFQDAADAERRWLDERLASVDPARFAELAGTFRDATRLEADFWQMGLERRF
ncbi:MULTISPECIES: thiaminase II [unclassified Chelatococcus]|uniref:thiaminase II n=1 Tax=unclassified Chelatococcus TaxID=2638111 RepID=UPI001BD078D9|nr:MULTISPECIES: thiaminase II [unclassified Chelatococcus]CAH1651279.1 Aminopyrimidine aminohydrolase [Hyphomicrobiales bacterium]MBS7739837.1 thiaminase II [Chelatococcus sp. HY11]MBX3545481.1 thiaminase II [Chelatococcus sp.]MCO5078864.1 thiaminase II [Chelatococcus sp.]CAH1686320.1 Aminopyrimidine aminohydrolase [Hyphomicrobiales bacterium]